MYFNIFNHIDVIKIKNNFLIINTQNKSIFDITKTVYKLLKKCENGVPLNKLTKKSIK